MGLTVVLLFVGLVLGLPLAVAMVLSAMFGVNALGLPFDVIAQRMYLQVTNPSFLAIPFFLFTGELMVRTGVADRLIVLARALVGHWRGGLAQSNLVMSVGFASVSASGVADVAASAPIFVPAMKKEGYPGPLATAMVAAGGVLGPILPPSIIMVIYGSLANLSVGQLFLASLGPGLLILLLNMCLVWWYSTKKLGLARSQRPSFRAVSGALREAVLALVAPLIIVGGIVGGVFTASESGAIAALYVLLLGLTVYRSLNVRTLWAAARTALIGSATVLFIIAASAVIAWLVSFTNVPRALEAFLSNFDSVIVIVALCAAVMVLIGTVMEPLGAAIVLIPLVHPIVVAAGADPYHFAAVIAVAIVCGGITPPVGIYLFVAAGAVNESASKVSLAVLPFVAVVLLALGILIAVPSVATWLPGIAG